jgi:hypothetical protein
MSRHVGASFPFRMSTTRPARSVPLAIMGPSVLFCTPNRTHSILLGPIASASTAHTLSAADGARWPPFLRAVHGCRIGTKRRSRARLPNRNQTSYSACQIGPTASYSVLFASTQSAATLSQLTALTALNLGYCHKLGTPDELRLLGAALPRLAVLDLSGLPLTPLQPPPWSRPAQPPSRIASESNTMVRRGASGAGRLQ